MPKVKTKTAFKTKTNHVISRGPGEIINMPDEDYQEVKDKVTLMERTMSASMTGLTSKKDKMIRGQRDK